MANPEPSFTIVLVGDHDVCESLADPIRERPSLLLTGIVATGEAAATVVGLAPDVVVLVDGGRHGGADSAVLAAQIGWALPASRLLVAVRGQGPIDAGALIDAWVGGVIDIDGEMALVDAIEALAHGEALLHPAVAAAVLERHQAGRSSVPLTATEEEVLRRLAAGDTVDALAAEHAVSPRLVRLHAGGALARLHPVA